VGSQSDQKLAIRTIAVSARAAIGSSLRIGRPDVAAECARRGLMMLAGLREELGPNVPDELVQPLEEAIRDLASTADRLTGEDAAALSIEVPEGQAGRRGPS
jgi:hypothetical protein